MTLLLPNVEIARHLEEVAWLLEEQGANLYRVHAYRHAAETVRHLPRSVADIVYEEGMAGLCRLPGIGESLARSIRELVLTGRLPALADPWSGREREVWRKLAMAVFTSNSLPWFS